MSVSSGNNDLGFFRRSLDYALAPVIAARNHVEVRVVTGLGDGARYATDLAMRSVAVFVRGYCPPAAESSEQSAAVVSQIAGNFVANNPRVIEGVRQGFDSSEKGAQYLADRSDHVANKSQESAPGWCVIS